MIIYQENGFISYRLLNKALYPFHFYPEVYLLMILAKTPISHYLVFLRVLFSSLLVDLCRGIRLLNTALACFSNIFKLQK
jgi:RAB protein geranylgeranyltransferase component A